MAEIKSALELAMERSKRFAISDQERDEIKRREIEQKATGLFHRYIEGHLSLHEILKEIERADEKTRTVIKEILLSQWIDALSLQEEDERLLKGIESLKGRSLDEIREKLHRLSQDLSEKKEDARQKAREEMTGELRRMGIYGGAVEPNTTGSQVMKSLLEPIDLMYREEIRSVKEELKNL
jgi:DNA-directed RNA polymerase alpha subunit